MLALNTVSRAYVVWGACGVLIVAGYVWTSNAPTPHACSDVPEPAECFGRALVVTLADEGVPAALRYVDEVVIPAHGYAVVHILMHVIGEYAYAQERDLIASFRYLEPYINSGAHPQNLSGFDGFHHGVITSYFFEHQAEDPHELVRTVCESDLRVPGDVFASPMECYHTLGHAILYSRANDIEAALSVCGSVADSTKRNSCYYGVFMEVAFLYSPTYHPESSRAMISGDSMFGICTTLAASEMPHCAHFIGQSYLATHPKDLRGAFAECAKLPAGEETCIRRLGSMFITSQFKGDHSAMYAACAMAGTYEFACRASVDEGLRAKFDGI